MRKLLAGCGVLLVASAALAAEPYRLEQVVGQVHGNRTGCRIDASNSSGWTRGGEHFKDPLLANIAIYDCPGAVDHMPASMIVIAPDGYRQEGCARPGRPGDKGCSARLRTPPPKGGAPQRYRLLIQLRPGEAVQPVDIDVSRRFGWRSATFDALLSA